MYLYYIYCKLKHISVLQGYPEFLETYACVTYFEWHTTAACRSVSDDTVEAMCYVYDAKGRMRDLNPLIKTSSPYRVVTGDDSEMFINVCRDISPGAYFCMTRESDLFPLLLFVVMASKLTQTGPCQIS